MQRLPPPRFDALPAIAGRAIQQMIAHLGHWASILILVTSDSTNLSIGARLGLWARIFKMQRQRFMNRRFRTRPLLLHYRNVQTLSTLLLM